MKEVHPGRAADCAFCTQKRVKKRRTLSNTTLTLNIITIILLIIALGISIHMLAVTY